MLRNNFNLEMNDKDALQDLIYKFNNEVGCHWTNEDKLVFIQKIKEFLEFSKETDR